MKQKVLDAIKDFYETCYTMFKLSAGDFAKENFPKIVENFWDSTKSDEDNLTKIKAVFESNKSLNIISGSLAAAQNYIRVSRRLAQQTLSIINYIFNYG